MINSSDDITGFTWNCTGSNPLIEKDGELQNLTLTASDVAYGFGATNATLNSGSSWQAVSNDDQPWLQVVSYPLSFI